MMTNDETLDVGIESVDGRVHVAVRGDIDAFSVFTLRAALEQVNPADTVVLDVSQVGFMDSSGVSVVAVLLGQQREGGGSLSISGASPMVRRVVDIVGLGELLDP